MQHFDELRDGRLGIVLRVIVSSGHLQSWSTKELGSGGHRWFEGDAVDATHVIRDEQRIDVSVWIERRDVAPNPCGRRLVSAPDRNIFHYDVRTPISVLLNADVRGRKCSLKFLNRGRYILLHGTPLAIVVRSDGSKREMLSQWNLILVADHFA